jgi:hypothetical protein
MHRHMPLITLLILCFVMTFVIWGFFGYHLWLVARGLTTNESFKWQGVTNYFKRLRKEHAAAAKSIEAAKEVLAACQKNGEGTGGDAEQEALQKLELLQVEHNDLMELTQDDITTPKNAYNNGFLVR